MEKGWKKDGKRMEKGWKKSLTFIKEFANFLQKEGIRVQKCSDISGG
jgi:hypothetical protein